MKHLDTVPAIGYDSPLVNQAFSTPIVSGSSLSTSLRTRPQACLERRTGMRFLPFSVLLCVYAVTGPPAFGENY